ncbi:hypothetical protein AAHA92_04689 [Salvia divinorum]|uniref:PGG domain-containing protein n=1 Tax=Salvia divinorum TaxID=28513 RepID=A0ABD1I1A3_SALDI
MDETLYKATMEGNTESLISLIEQDPLLLERRIGTTTTPRLETPLHVASMLGHEAFVAELLRRKPRLARELDSTRSSALHLASANDHVGVVRALLQVEPDMCSVCDRGGRNPLQIAAMMGRISVLREMLVVRADAATSPILHICAEYSQFDALEVLVGSVELQYLINSRDRDGNTVLHLAVAHRQVQMTELLLSIPGIEVEAANSSGMTPSHILMQRLHPDTRDLHIHDSLTRAGAVLPHLPPQINHLRPCHDRNLEKKTKSVRSQGDWLDKQRSALMVVASLIATMAFQFAVTPPPPVWTSGTSSRASDDNPRAVMYYVRRAGDYLKDGERFYTVTTASFIASLSIILLLMSGLPLNNRVVVWLLMIITWVAISGLAFSYTVSVLMQTPPSKEKYIYAMFAITVFAWNCLVSLLLIGHTIRFIVMVLKMFVKMIKLVVRFLSVRRRRRPVSAAQV